MNVFCTNVSHVKNTSSILTLWPWKPRLPSSPFLPISPLKKSKEKNNFLWKRLKYSGVYSSFIGKTCDLQMTNLGTSQTAGPRTFRLSPYILTGTTRLSRLSKPAHALILLRKMETSWREAFFTSAWVFALRTISSSVTGEVWTKKLMTLSIHSEK